MNMRSVTLTLAAASFLAVAGCHRGDRSTTAADGSTVTLRHGNTPLHVAVANGDYATAKSLLDGGADPNELNNRGETPLMTAANRGLTPIVDLLLAKHPNLDVTNKWGKSALTFAVEQQSVAIVRRLVAAGASTNVVDYKGRSLDVYAKGNPSVLDALHGGRGQLTSPPPEVQQRMDAQPKTSNAAPSLPAYPSQPAEPPAAPMTPSTPSTPTPPSTMP